MANISELAVANYRDVARGSGLLERAQIKSQEYWEGRRQAISCVIGDTTLTPEARVETILEGEQWAAISYERDRKETARRLAVSALLADDGMDGAQKLQYLTEIETGKTDVSGHASHADAVDSMLDNTSHAAPDGLILRLDYTEPVMGGTTRKLVGATPYKVNTVDLGYCRFEPAAETGKASDGRRLLTDESGLYFRYALDVLAWQREHGKPIEHGVRTYGVYSHREDKMTWSPHGGYAWATGEYPTRGPVMMRGEQNITEFVERMLSFGGIRLDFIQAAVEDYPGFGFIHDIKPTGDHGADADGVATRPE